MLTTHLFAFCHLLLPLLFQLKHISFFFASAHVGPMLGDRTAFGMHEFVLPVHHPPRLTFPCAKWDKPSCRRRKHACSKGAHKVMSGSMHSRLQWFTDCCNADWDNAQRWLFDFLPNLSLRNWKDALQPVCHFLQRGPNELIWIVARP